MRRWVDDGRFGSRPKGGERLIEGAELARFLTETAPPGDEPPVLESARNRFPGIVTQVQKDGLVAVVHIQAGPHRVTSLMTREAADDLGHRARRSRGRGREVDERGRGSSTTRVRQEHSVRRTLRVWVVALVVAALGLVGATGVAQAAKAKKPSGTITVSAAASLTEAFTKMGADFQKANPGTTVTFNFGVVVHARAADPGRCARRRLRIRRRHEHAEARSPVGEVTAEPTVFAANLLTIVVKKGNPKNVKSLADLANLDVVSLCADDGAVRQVRATRSLAGAGVTIPPEKITTGADVKTTLAAVTTGDADAAIVYITDAKAAGTTVQAVRIPAWLNVYAIYPIAPIAASENQDLANAWVEYTASPAGQKTLQSFGFLPPPPQ